MSEETRGKLDEAKGRVKKAAGDLTADDQLHREGQVDEKSGQARQTVADVSDKVGDAIEKVSDSVKDVVGRGSGEGKGD